MLKSNRELFESFNVLDTTWKKWSREFLPPDPEAGRRRGKTRMYTAEQAFLVWAGGRMLNEKNMTYEEAKEAVNVLEKFMIEQKYIPLKDTGPHTIESVGPYDTAVTWIFRIDRTANGNYHSFRGYIGSEKKEWIGSDGEKRPYDVEKYFDIKLYDGKIKEAVICTVSITVSRWFAEFGYLSGFPIYGNFTKTVKPG